MISIVSTHGARTPMRKLEQAAVHLPAKGVSNEKEFLTLTRSPLLFIWILIGFSQIKLSHASNYEL